MCQGCWRKDYGASRIDNERVRAARDLIADVYEHSLVGGNLHVMLDDFNLEDSAFDGQQLLWIAQEAEPRKRLAELACFEAMRALSLAERASALALFWGYWETA